MSLARALLTIALAAVVVVGVLLILKLVVPGSLWVRIDACNPGHLELEVGNDSPVPVRASRATLHVYDRGGSPAASLTLDLGGSWVWMGFTHESRVSLNLDPGEISRVVVVVEYELAFMRYTLNATVTPVCPR